MNVDQAIIHKQFWQSQRLVRYATALLTEALRLRSSGLVHFNNDDVPEVSQPGDQTTVGAVFRLLTMEHVIEPWRGTIESRQIYGGMRRSTRPCNNGHRNQLYSLTSAGIAEEWLRRHGAAVAPVQQEMALTC